MGFEWTSSPGGNNLYRNVIFRDGKDEVDQVLPFSNYDSTGPEDLWAWMQAYEEKTGGRALAVAHNGNLSNGLMFDDVTFSGKELDRDYAERRLRWEPIYEVTQMKGDGEAHPALSPNDEFADYGTWDKGSFGPEPKTRDMLPREYAREALKRGLAYEERLGANPFKVGMIGSTVLCSDDRAINEQHSCDKPVGNTVDVEKATYTNSIGDALMMAYWQDPAFDPKQRAFYYVRVLEIPTPRWTTYDAAFFGVDLPEGVPATHQERAYTSPNWYTPAS